MDALDRDTKPGTNPRRKAALASALVLGATAVLIYLTVMAKMFLR
jgi:hypothetical protein